MAIRERSGDHEFLAAMNGYESGVPAPALAGSRQPVDRPRWRPLPVEEDNSLAAVPAVISLLAWPALRMLVELPVYLVRRLFR